MIFNMSTGGASTADKIKYDNTESGLQSTNVQGAVDELNNSLAAKGDFELLCYATSLGNITVPNLTKYKSIWATLVIDNSLNGNLLIPLSLFKTITTYSRCSYYESSGAYACDFKYVNDTTINISQLYRIIGCYLYGIK